MTNGNRATLGAVLGVLFGFGICLIIFMVGPKQPGYLSTGVEILMLIVMFPVVAAVTGPGAFLLSWIHAVRMARYARRARTPGEIRTIGILLGLPLGVAYLILGAALLAIAEGQRLQPLQPADLPFFLLIGIVSGVGIGWGATTGLEPGAVPANRVIRRNGPPFFDGHPGRIE